MSISEQVKELRLIAKEYGKPPYGMEVRGTVEALCKAADTIETLSAKLQAANMERLTMQEKIIGKVLEERKRQDAKWGEQNHSSYVWASIIGEEYGEMCKAINEFGFNPTLDREQDIYTEAIQTIASCMAMLECMERNRVATQNNNKEDLESGRLVT